MKTTISDLFEQKQEQIPDLILFYSLRPHDASRELKKKTGFAGTCKAFQKSGGRVSGMWDTRPS